MGGIGASRSIGGVGESAGCLVGESTHGLSFHGGRIKKLKIAQTGL